MFQFHMESFTVEFIETEIRITVHIMRQKNGRLALRSHKMKPCSPT